MAYSELLWRPFLGHQAWSWTTLRRGNVFYYVYKRFLKNFVTFLRFITFFYFYLNVFTYMIKNRQKYIQTPTLKRQTERTIRGIITKLNLAHIGAVIIIIVIIIYFQNIIKRSCSAISQSVFFYIVYCYLFWFYFVYCYLSLSVTTGDACMFDMCN